MVHRKLMSLFLAGQAFFGLGCAFPGNESALESGRPNIIFLLVDDLGYMDVGAYAFKVTGTEPSNQFYETPNINDLVHKGVAFSQAYAAPLCSPTRAALLTGIYPSKWGFNTATPGKRSEERRVGKECVRTCRYRG